MYKTVDAFMESVISKNPGQDEFHQAVREVVESIWDYLQNNPHYHYGPRNKNIRLYWEKTVTPDTLYWTLEQFKEKKLPVMIRKAGYPGIAEELDEYLIESKIPEIESTAIEMVKKNAR